MEWYRALSEGRGSHDHGPKSRLETWPPWRALLRCGRRLLVGTAPSRWEACSIRLRCAGRSYKFADNAWLRSITVVGLRWTRTVNRVRQAPDGARWGGGLSVWRLSTPVSKSPDLAGLKFPISGPISSERRSQIPHLRGWRGQGAGGPAENAGTLFVFEPVALAAEVDRGRVVEQAGDDGGGGSIVT